MTGDSSVHEVPVTDEAGEWDDPQQTDEVDPFVGAIVGIVVGTSLVLFSIPGMAVLMEEGATLTSYGTVGTAVLFLAGVGFLYLSGIFYKEQQQELEAQEGTDERLG